MIRIYFTNFHYFAEPQFATLEEAKSYAVSKCFEVTFMRDGIAFASWSPIGGFRGL